jgi:hypothetical protein
MEADNQKAAINRGTPWSRRAGHLVQRVCLALFCWTMSLVQLPAQTNAAKPSGPSNRYLLVVETSRAMQRRSDGMMKTVQSLLATGMGGQVHKGDTIGLWTFNEELHVGIFPLQQWSPGAHRGIMGKMLNFLSEQKFEKQTSFDKVMTGLSRVINESEFITVILVSDGSEKLQGTPFDDAINEAYKSWRSEQQRARMPFITVLRGKRGKLTDYTVNPAQWPLDMPPLPLELVPPVAQAPAAAPKGPPPVGQSLFLTGKKSQPAQPGPAPDVLPQPKFDTPPAIPGAQIVASEVKPTVNTNVQAPSARTEPVSAPVEPSGLVAETTRIDVDAKGPVRPNQETVSVQSKPAVPAPLALSETPKPVAEAPRRADGLPKAAEAPALRPDAPAPSVTAQAQKNAPTPAPAVTVEAKPAAEAAVALPPEPLFNLRIVWIGALLLALVACGFVVKAMKRSRAISHASLITRSLDRNRKE